ncbi:hypothetical protein HNP00_001524 [Arthrobacter sp. AZCC_0090]|nr:hypothetical protein [Arthrobacter sp. AZCC_0090]
MSLRRSIQVKIGAGPLSVKSKLLTPRTVRGRLYVLVASAGGLWAAQWLVFWVTSSWTPKPTVASLVMFSIIFLFFVLTLKPGVPWFPPRRD